MPAKGQPRKPRSLSRLTRIGITAGTGAAALALPLAFAGHAAAAEPAKAPAAAKTATVRHYTVVHGDTLAKIAARRHVVGGWHKLYQVNKKVIGGNPNLIRPGERLVLPAPAAKKPLAKPAVKPAAKPAPAKQAAATTNTGWTKPVGNAAIGTPYHQAGSNWSSGYHTGVDFLVWTGTPVHSVAAGTVVQAGPDGAYGNDVIVRHADGKYTLYGHLSQVEVSVGATVTEGQQIGLSGATGNVTGPHLHFEVRTTPYYGSDIDPVAYLASHGVTI
jgi:murein DD-endopeptidase MepM/ murein hydrolase activator NlpD